MLHPPPTLAVGGRFFMSAPPRFYFFTFPLDTELYHSYNTVNNRTI